MSGGAQTFLLIQKSDSRRPDVKFQDVKEVFMEFKNIQETAAEDKKSLDTSENPGSKAETASYADPAATASLHFYYNREERLKNAPQSVRDYYEGKMNPEKGLFRVLVSNRSNKFLLISIVLLAAFIWMFNFLSKNVSDRIFGTECSLEAFSFDDTVYASLKFDEVKKSGIKACLKNSLQTGGTSGSSSGEKSGEGAYSLPFTVVFTAFDNSGLVSDKKEIQEFFTGNELFVRTKFSDYDIIKVTALVQSEFESKEISAFIQRK